MDKFGRVRRRLVVEWNIRKPGELVLFERVKALKQKRQFMPTLRNALRLFFALLDGDLSVLYELFPGIVEQIKKDAVTNALLTEFQSYMLRGQIQPVMVAAPVVHQAELDALPNLFVNDGAGGESVSPAEARVNFASGMGNLFDDDEDEWQ